MNPSPLTEIPTGTLLTQRRRINPRRDGVQSSITSTKDKESDCTVGHNTIRFRHDDNSSFELFEESSNSFDSDECGSNGMEVMDLRHSSDDIVRCLSSSSLFSFSQGYNPVNGIIDSQTRLTSSRSHEHVELFPVANGTGGGSNKLESSCGGKSTLSDNDVPKHWQASSGGTQTSETGVDGEKERTYNALISSIRNFNHRGAVRRGSRGETVGTGFWSSLASHHVGSGDVENSSSGSASCASSELTESSPLTDSKKPRNQTFRGRWRAKAMVGVMASAALVYFIANENYESMFEILPTDNFLGKLFRSGDLEEQNHDDTKSQKERNRNRRERRAARRRTMSQPDGSYFDVSQNELVDERLNDHQQEYGKYIYIEDGHRILATERQDYEYIHQNYIVHEHN
mmetsp:Transcript_36626/g.76852  ORF Transcript_36626/g.76852 Transcript_36626/m.76852 type:complete len:400 (-) Transcript_36626:87-1286(-)